MSEYLVSVQDRTVIISGASISAHKDADSIELPDFTIVFDKYTDEQVYIDAAKAVIIQCANKYRSVCTHKDSDKIKPHSLSTWASVIGNTVHPMPKDQATKTRSIVKATDTIKKALDDLIRTGLTREEALEKLGF